jgi:hypothetical protein
MWLAKSSLASVVLPRRNTGVSRASTASFWPTPSTAGAGSDSKTPQPQQHQQLQKQQGRGCWGCAASSSAAGPPGGKQLPGLPLQAAYIFRRSARKWVNDRDTLVSDVFLTALLALILGAAQGGSQRPQSSLVWMIITMMAFGCLTLVRSLRSFGPERIIFLQREHRVSDAGCVGCGISGDCSSSGAIRHVDTPAIAHL